VANHAPAVGSAPTLSSFLLSPVSLVWFRRDLRSHDHPALTAALAAGPVVCLFVLEPRLLARSPNRAWFVGESVAALADDVHARGGLFFVREGPAEATVPAVARELGAAAVHVSREYSPFGRARDRRVAAALARAGIAFHEHPGVLAVEPEQVVNANAADGAFQVFAAFHRRWEAVPRRPVLPAPAHIPAPASASAAIASGFGSWRPPAPAASLLPGGEGAARARLAAWLPKLPAYAATRDRLDMDGTSRLSQDLRFGLLSPVEVLAAAGEASPAFGREVAFREFYTHLAWRLPRVLREPFRPQPSLAPRDDATVFAAWCEGRTGVPLVDAAMHQLVRTGWMHNRARMVTATYLAKTLRIDYRLGEAFFLRHLTDGDPAVNNGGWQWAASTGAGAPFRTFNPTIQSGKHDPTGDYVRAFGS